MRLWESNSAAMRQHLLLYTTMFELSDSDSCDSSPSKRPYDLAETYTRDVSRALQLAVANGVTELRSDEKTLTGSEGVAAAAAVNPYHEGKDIFFPVPGCELSSFQQLPLLSSMDHHGSPTPPLSGGSHGRKVEVNGKELALFCHREKLYAVGDRCPHMGGPLHLGEIEDLGATLPPRVVCPWHKWCFDLQSGRQVRPRHRHNNIQSYPVRTKPSGQIAIGFDAFHASYFNTEDF